MESTSAKTIVFFLFILAPYKDVHPQPSNFNTKDIVSDIDNNSVTTIDQYVASNSEYKQQIW